MRLYEELIARGMASDEHEARGLIMAGRVRVDGVRRDKPSYEVRSRETIAVTSGRFYVSRGGWKLERALNVFGIDLTGLRCIDIGASTGGFTDCMLKRGAEQIYAVDVGYGLLDWSLRNDHRVVLRERVNARSLEQKMFDGVCHFASVDVSFISLRHILPALLPCLDKGARVIALVKPQFEADRRQVERGGIIRNPSVRGETLRKVRGYAENAGFTYIRTTPSPITGTDGNVEFLMLLHTRDN